MKSMIRRIAIGVAALGLSLPALASTATTPVASAAPAQKPAVSAKAHKQKRTHHKVAAAEKKVEEKKTEKKVEQKAEVKAEQKAAPKAEQKPAEKPVAPPAK